MPGGFGTGPTNFSFPTLGPTSMTFSGGAAAVHHQMSRLALASSVPIGALDAVGYSSAYHSPHTMYSPRPYSRSPTPLHSGYPTPRSSMNGSVYGSVISEQHLEERLSPMRGRQLERMLSGVERGLDTPLWVARLRLVGRLLLAVLFANLLWQELLEWRASKGYGWRAWYDLGWLASEPPPLAPLLSLAALVLLLAGWGTTLAAGWLAARLLAQSLELWDEIFAVLEEQTSNLLPVKELAVVGTVLGFIGHTYYVPDWLRGAGGAKGRATGLMYTQRWRPGQSVLSAAGQLLVAPLFISIAALQFYDLTSPHVGVSGWRARLLSSHHWLPPGDASANNWLPAQAAAYLLLATGLDNKRLPSLLAALLVAEALTCWRWWSPVWMSQHYVWHLRRHFAANLAIAGGLLLNLPEGKHDAQDVRAEAAIGKKRT